MEQNLRIHSSVEQALPGPFQKLDNVPRWEQDPAAPFQVWHDSRWNRPFQVSSAVRNMHTLWNYNYVEARIGTSQTHSVVGQRPIIISPAKPVASCQLAQDKARPLKRAKKRPCHQRHGICEKVGHVSSFSKGQVYGSSQRNVPLSSQEPKVDVYSGWMDGWMDDVLWWCSG